MKKYKVSLAMKIPANFEVEIMAKSEKAAFEDALVKYYSGEYRDNITDPNWYNVDLDIDTKGSIHKLGNGIYIEEID